MDETKMGVGDEFDIFLSKVKEVGSIIKDISSKDIETVKRGIEKAEEHCHKEEKASAYDNDGNTTVYSKTLLNRKALDETSEALDSSGMSTGEFMAAVEKDAKDRYEKRNSTK